MGDQAGIAISYGQLGVLAHARGDYAEAERRYAQSLHINERLGDQAGIAGSYHQLGLLAQDRGDYGQAERRYAQSLHINERLGKQADMATILSEQGNLAMVRDGLTTAVILHIRALTIRRNIGVPQVGNNIHALVNLRHKLGTTQFRRELAKVLDAEDIEPLNQLLDQAEAGQ